MVFDWLLAHYEEAPRYVIYDNACNLMRYALSREPVFFQNTTFAVDCFHQPSHRDCPVCCDANLYTELERVNTQLLEQFWSQMTINKTSLAYMNRVNFAVLLRDAVTSVVDK